VTALREVAAYIPSPVPLEALSQRLGLTPLQTRVFRRLHGLDRIAMADNENWSDLLLAAAAGLDGLRSAAARVRYVIAGRTIAFAIPRNQRPLADVCDKLGLSNAVSFSVTELACASGLFALDLAGQRLAADGDPDAMALVFSGEKAFTPDIQHAPETTIMGEAVAACLVTTDGDADRVLSYATSTQGEFYREQDDPDAAAAFREVYPGLVADIATEAVRQANLGWDDIQLVLPHNVNRVSWVQVAKLLGLPLDRIYLDLVPAYGHCFAADPFLNYLKARDAGRLASGRPYLMVAAGLGAVASAMVLCH
jgi:3-oxoacyl-[acyl-carrier-protein] synthase III